MQQVSRNFFVILGGQSRLPNQKVVKLAKEQRVEPNLDILKESPCLRCGLFVSRTVCSYVKGCGKIDEFQRLAAVHCTLYKPHDVFPIAKI